jgi:hypothetical protein
MPVDRRIPWRFVNAGREPRGGELKSFHRPYRLPFSRRPDEPGALGRSRSSARPRSQKAASLAPMELEAFRASCDPVVRSRFESERSYARAAVFRHEVAGMTVDRMNEIV